MGAKALDRRTRGRQEAATTRTRRARVAREPVSPRRTLETEPGRHAGIVDIISYSDKSFADALSKGITDVARRHPELAPYEFRILAQEGDLSPTGKITRYRIHFAVVGLHR